MLIETRTARGFHARNGFIVSGTLQVWAGMEGFPTTNFSMAKPSAKGTLGD